MNANNATFAVVVEFVVEPGRGEEFLPHMLEQAKNSLELEDECRRFDVFTDPERPDTFVLYELYDDEAAFEAHLRTDHFAAFSARVGPIVKSRDIRRLHRA